MDGLIAYALAKKYINQAISEISLDGFDIQIEQDRSILNSEGQEKIIYFVPKTTAATQDGYDEYVYISNSWEKVGSTDIDMSAYALKSEIPNVSGKENTSNKVTSVSASSTDDQYPSAKCVYDIMVAVLKTDISSAIVTLSADSFVYDGTSKVPSVTAVTLDGTTLTAGVDYAVVSVPATNAGSYSLSINGIGDFTGVVTANWAITKATPTISGDDSISIVGTDESVSKTYTTNSDGAFSFALSDNIATLSSVGGTVTIESTTTGSTTLTVSVAATSNFNAATKTVSLEITAAQTVTVFGVIWDYSLNSPALTRLTPQTDPLGVVTHCPTTEPTVQDGISTEGQSEFNNYLPWSGMVRKNYVNGQLVDFTGYDNGETYVYIPPFWSKIVDDFEHSKMYFYVSSEELTGFTKHLGSNRYIGRYPCDSSFMSRPSETPKVNTSFSSFRNGVSLIDNYHFQWDIHIKEARDLLYLIEFASFNSQAAIGIGIADSNIIRTSGLTDTLTYHTGSSNTSSAMAAIQYRWIENPWGNIDEFVDGILINNASIYICDDYTKYADTITADYFDTGLDTPTTNNNQFIILEKSYNNGYLFPLSTGGSSSTYTCDAFNYLSGLRALNIGGDYGSVNGLSGLFTWQCNRAPTESVAYIGSRPMLIITAGGET